MGALIGGIIAVVLGILGLVKWGSSFVEVFKGSVPFLLLVGGIIAIAAGISDIKDKIEEKKEKEKEEKKEQEKKEEEKKES